METGRLKAGETLLPWFREVLSTLLEHRDLSAAQMREVMNDLMSGCCGDAETAALLVALRMKGESATEIAAAASSLREHMIPIETGRDFVLDTCGTGGDGTSTFNISTAAALVAAGAGVPVVKHGNRAVSSRSGSADVLQALGVSIESDPAGARQCLDRVGLVFCFGPRFHPALGHVGAVRRRLGISTIFNCLGPLANPARAPYQLLGVGRADLLDRMAAALAHFDVRRALLVCGKDGLDEVTLSAATMVREVRGKTVIAWEWTPRDFGLEECVLANLHAKDADESAAIIRGILDGKDGPATRVVLANAAAALFAAERVPSPAAGVEAAAQAIASGKARKVLDDLVDCSRPRPD